MTAPHSGAAPFATQVCGWQQVAGTQSASVWHRAFAPGAEASPSVLAGDSFSAVIASLGLGAAEVVGAAKGSGLAGSELGREQAAMKRAQLSAQVSALEVLEGMRETVTRSAWSVNARNRDDGGLRT